MNADESTAQLSNELHQAIEAVTLALNLTTNERKLLREKAVVAKNQIQDDVSFHLELLRNREVWLLEQVDVHAQMKEETFESHLNQLCVLLAKLEVYEQLLNTQELQENEVITSQTKKILSTLSNEVLHSEEASRICFSADNFALSDAVKNFGHITDAEHREPSQKLPRVHQKKSSSKEGIRELMFIQEHFKCVANSPQKEWLIAEVGDQSKELRKDFGIMRGFFEELKRSDCKEWLYEKPQPMDVETVSNRVNAHFQKVKASSVTVWLQSGVASDVTDDSPRYTTLDTSANIKDWLLRPIEALSSSSKDEEMIDEGISLSRQCSVEKRLPDKTIHGKYINGYSDWLLSEKLIENRSSSEESSIGEKIDDDWLLPGGYTSYKSKEAQSGSWLQHFRESSGTRTSDWLIATEGEAEPDYCEWLTQESIERCKSCPGECAMDTFGVFRNVLNSSKSEWLATASDW